MTSSPGTVASHAPHLHITTGSCLTTAPSNHHQSHSPSSARSPNSSSGSPSPRSSGTGGGGGSGSTNQACAACKYQRRKCNPDCPLAPYFPADQQLRFLHAHRLFGVSNILKTLRRLRPELCADAMGTLIFQAEMRAQDPVGGCYRLILGLERQLDVERAELAAVLNHLALCRQAAAVPPPLAGGAAADLDVTASSNQPLLLNAQPEVIIDALYAKQEADNAILSTDDHPHDQGHSPQDHSEEHHQQQLFDYFYYDTTAGGDASSKPVTLDINVDSLQQFDYDDSSVAGQKVEMAPAMHEELAVGQQQQLDVNCHIDHKDYEMKPALLVDVFDMRQAVDVKPDDIDVKAVGITANINININEVDVNVDVDLNEELQEKDANNNIAAGEAPQTAVESSHCRLGLCFSAF